MAGDFDTIRTMLRRVRLLELDNSGTLQTLRVAGLKGEQLAGVPRVQPFGFSANPPAGAEGLLLALSGRSDRAMVLGVEHPAHRPSAREGGSTALYDANGNIVSLVQAEIRVRHATKIVLEAGGVTLTVDASGVTVAGGMVRHQGRNIGSTHTHGGVMAGPASTSVPD